MNAESIKEQLRDALAAELLSRIQAGDAPASLIKEAREFLKDLDMAKLADASQGGPNVVGQELLAGLDSALYN